MKALLCYQFYASELAHFNHILINQQVLYLLDVMAVNGKSIDDRYWGSREDTKQWSSYIWPKVYLSVTDLECWHQVLMAIAPKH